MDGKKKAKRRPHLEWLKGEAMLVKENDQTTYADIPLKVMDDPNLKDLGENVVKMWRIQKGEMLFELKSEPAIKSSAYQELDAKSLAKKADVTALTKEAVVGCRYQDKKTTVDEVSEKLRKQYSLVKT